MAGAFGRYTDAELDLAAQEVSRTLDLLKAQLDDAKARRAAAKTRLSGVVYQFVKFIVTFGSLATTDFSLSWSLFFTLAGGCLYAWDALDLLVLLRRTVKLEEAVYRLVVRQTLILEEIRDRRGRKGPKAPP